MKLVIPKQHGAWAMLVIPFLLSVILGKPTIYHIVYSLVLYLFSYVSIPYVHKAKTKKRVFTCSNCVFYHRFYIWDDFSIIGMAHSFIRSSHDSILYSKYVLRSSKK